MRMYVYVYTYTYICIYALSYIYIYIHTYIHIYTCYSVHLLVRQRALLQADAAHPLPLGEEVEREPGRHLQRRLVLHRHARVDAAVRDPDRL